MKLAVMSDLHMEFRDYDLKFVKSLKPEQDVDVIILAGDIMPFKQDFRKDFKTLGVLKCFADMAPYVIYVAGNHEYYGSSPEEAWEVIDFYNNYGLISWQGPKNLHVVGCPQWLLVKNQRFLLGTMWYSRAAIKKIPGDPDTGRFDHIHPLMGDVRTYQFSDFRHIRKAAEIIYPYNHLFNNMLTRELCDTDVVVTHHLPSPQSTPPRFKGEPDNAFYVHDKTALIRRRRPKLWIHGHTHSAFDYTIGSTPHPM